MIDILVVNSISNGNVGNDMYPEFHWNRWDGLDWLAGLENERDEPALALGGDIFRVI
jgi:hypothetical protein